MQNCILIRDPHEYENIIGVIIGDITYEAVDELADQFRGDDDEESDYRAFVEKLQEMGCTVFGGILDEIEL